MKKGDIFIAATVVLLSLTVAVMLYFKGGGTTVTVKQDNKTVYSGSLFDDTEIKLSGNTVTVKDGKAYMSWGSCKNQLCIHKGEISKAGESIICLPNKVIVETE